MPSSPATDMAPVAPDSEPNSPSRASIGRESIRAAHLAPTAPLIANAVAALNLSAAQRARIHDNAVLLATHARAASRKEGLALRLVHRFGLGTPQGIALMQLAEALPRASDAASAHELIADKLTGLTWRDAISDRPAWLERLALHGLDLVSRAFRDPKPHDRTQRAAHWFTTKAIATLSRQYVMGETLTQAERRARALIRQGYRLSYDMLGEAAITDAAARAFQQSYFSAIDTLAARRQREMHAISVKLSALHPRFEDRQRARTLPVLCERMLAIAERARAANVPLTIDAEESERLELTLDVFEHLAMAPTLAGWNGLGLAVQAYQRRAASVIDWLAELARDTRRRIGVRLVKGAYWDAEVKRAQQLGLSDYPVFMRKCDTDVNYLACARRLLSAPEQFFAQFATHNAHTLAAVVELAEQAGHRDFELQRLHGMGEHIHGALLQRGIASRIYAPVGPRDDLLPYLVRRLLENGASSSFVRQLADGHVPLAQLVHDPIATAETPPKRVAVGAPVEIRQQFWNAARGMDLSARAETAALLTYLQIAHQPRNAAALIDGEPIKGTARAVHNPARLDDTVGHVIDATLDNVVQAVDVAYAGFEPWSSRDARHRAGVLERAAQLLEDRAPQFVSLAVLEAGKTLDDAIGEVREAVDFCRHYAAQCRLPNMAQREALGVVACISPWNFPLAIFLGQVTGALAAGNTVVAKPAEQTPLIAFAATRLLHEAGVPTTALQLLTGDGEIGAALVAEQRITGVCFTGSLNAARAIAQKLAETCRGAVPFIAETGGINAMIVDSSSLPEQVVRDVLIGAFQSAGQRCSALRLLCVQDTIADRVMDLLRGALAELHVGDPAALETDVGPLIDAEARAQVTSYLRAHPPLAQAPLRDANGYFVAPSVIQVQSPPDIEREVFGPVLHVMRYASGSEQALLDSINAQGYGLTLGLHSRIRTRSLQLAEHAHIGNVYINRHQVGAMVGQQPFGGHGLSGTGPKAGGPHYLLRLTRNVREAGDCSITVSDSPLTADVVGLLEQTRRAQREWEAMSRRSERVQFACQLLAANPANGLHVDELRARLLSANALRTVLPAIAGEDNQLRLTPRGVLLCMSAPGNGRNSLAARVLMTVAAGNGALVIASTDQMERARAMAAQLEQCGIPQNLVGCVQALPSGIPSAWLTGLNIDGVVCDGTDADQHNIARYLVQRPGPLLPVLSSNDDAWRFCLEQTITINTAAAGGDPHLLGMGE